MANADSAPPVGHLAIWRRRRSIFRFRLKHSPFFRRTKLLLKYLAGREPWLRPDVSVELRRYGDWAFSTDRLPRNGRVYALGVGTDLGMELDLIAEFGVGVHAFDPSPGAVDWVATQRLPGELVFHACAVSERDGVLNMTARASDGSGVPVMYSAVATDRSGATITVESVCLPTVLRRLGHTRVDLVKMDVEGAEYGVIRSMLASSLRPEQLLVEFHHRFPGVGKVQTTAAVRALREAGYRLAFVSGTNREFTFLREA